MDNHKRLSRGTTGVPLLPSVPELEGSRLGIMSVDSRKRLSYEYYPPWGAVSFIGKACKTGMHARRHAWNCSAGDADRRTLRINSPHSFIPKSSTIIPKVTHPPPPQPPAGKRTALSRLVVWLVFFLVVTPLYMAVVFILLEWAQIIPYIDASLLTLARAVFVIPYLVIFISFYRYAREISAARASSPAQGRADAQEIDLSGVRGGEPFFTDEIDLLISSTQAMLNSLKRQKDELVETSAKMQELTRATLRLQEAERRFVARELHDQAGQLLVNLRYTVEALLADLPPDTPARGRSARNAAGMRQRLTDMLAQIDMTLETIRALSHRMRPALLDVGDINLAMQEYCNEFQRNKPIDIYYEGALLPYLNEETAISLFRFLQEALTNVLKHAEATEVHVRLAHRDGWIEMSVGDNGRGEAAGSGAAGIGILGMMERFQLLGGTVETQSSPGGFTITVRTPFEQSSAPDLNI